jgi:hypothetical protein
MPNYFTVDEARKALRKIIPFMDEIMTIRESILRQQPEKWSLVQSSAGNGGSPEASRLVKDFDRLDRLVHRVQDAGAVFKDINLGLLDFPAWREEHEVCLCWKVGEPDLQYWHELEAGFAGRQPIETF